MVVTTIYERVFLAGLFYRRNRTFGGDYQVFSDYLRPVRRSPCTIEVEIEQNRIMSRTNTHPQTLQVVSPPTGYSESEFWDMAPDDELICIFIQSNSNVALETLIRRQQYYIGASVYS
jgi:hypothetical protein